MEEMKKENELKKENEENSLAVVKDISMLGKRTDTKQEIFTNITDNKKLFNLSNHVDCLLNDCENESIHVKEVLIKRYEKPMKNPEIDEETGDILKDKEITMATTIIDDKNKSYATGSKVFGIQLMQYLEMFGLDEKGFDIKIVKRKNDNGNKTLGFELI